MGPSRLCEPNQIQCIDGAIPAALYTQLLQSLASVGWRFGWNTDSNPENRYWHHEVGRGAKNNVEDVSRIVAQHPIKAFAAFQDWMLQAFLPEGSRILRFYLNAHTYGTDGWPHVDTERTGDEVTAVTYLVSRKWEPGWGGETVVFDESANDIERAVMPARNRIFSFPSRRLHCPRPLSRNFGGLRVVLVIKAGVTF
jgi:SM-20-related protein